MVCSPFVYVPCFVWSYGSQSKHQLMYKIASQDKIRKFYYWHRNEKKAILSRGTIDCVHLWWRRLATVTGGHLDTEKKTGNKIISTHFSQTAVVQVGVDYLSLKLVGEVSRCGDQGLARSRTIYLRIRISNVSTGHYTGVACSRISQFGGKRTQKKRVRFLSFVPPGTGITG